MSEIRVDTISEKTSANGVAIDGVTIKDGGIAATAASTITTADNTDTLTLVSTDTDNASGPNLRLFRNSANPADSDDIGKITFSGENDAGEEIDYLTVRGDLTDVTDGTEDGILKIAGLIGGAVKEFARFGDGVGVVFNEESNAANDFRIESDALSHAFFLDSGTDHVSIGNSSTSLYTLDVKQNADFTGSSSDTANEAPLRVWSTHNNGRGAIAIGGNNNNGIYNKGANDLTIQGYNSVTFDVSTTNDDKFGTKTERFRISSTGKLATGAETDPDVDAGGLTLQQNAEDGQILSFKSSDIAHGMTSSAETDTYATFKKQSATLGGLQIRAFAEGNANERLIIDCQGDGDITTTKSASGKGAMVLGVNNKSGTGNGAVNSDANLLTIANYTSTRFIFDAEGTFHSDVGTATYDEYDDAHLVRAMDLSTSTKGLIASKFDEFIQYKHEDLADAKIVGRDEDGTPNSMVNWTAMSQLHNGAIWQQYEKTERLANAMYELAKAAVGEEKANEILEQNEIKLLN